MLTLPLGAHAANGTFGFAGSVMVNTCTVSSPTTQTVVLPTIVNSSMTGVGFASVGTPFTIQISGCGYATNGYPYFQGGTPTAADGNLANTGTAGVELQITNTNGSPINLLAALGSQGAYVTTLPVGSGPTSLNYAVRYYSLSAWPTPGTVSAAAVFSMEYE